jgi:predicted PurR-regulated permease PerM
MADTAKPTVLPSASEEPAEEERATADTLIADGPDDYRELAVVVLAVIGTILMLQFAKSVLIPVVVAVLISYVLGPAVTSMHKHGLPRILGSILVITLLCGGLGLGV